MDTWIRNSLAAFSFCFLTPAFTQGQAQDPADRYKMVFGHGKEGIYLYSMPDSASSNPQWPGRDTALWAFDMYLFSNYAATFKRERELSKLLPDTIAIRKRFRDMLEQDTAYARFFHHAMPDHRVPDIRIDSLLYIASRFYYLHRASGGGVTAHICVGINKVKELVRTEGSPYYAAFCYQVIRSQEDPFAIFYRAKDAAGDSIYNDMPEEQLHQAEHDIYRHAAADPELRQQLWSAYLAKRRYLNFQVLE
jgi:hypothetical protein